MQYAYSLLLDSAGETVALAAHDGLDALLDMEQRLGVKGEQRNCRRQELGERVRYVSGESGITNLALDAEESWARNSLVQQWAPRGV